MDQNSILYQKYHLLRRKYIVGKRAGKTMLRIPFYPLLAIRFIWEQLQFGYRPRLDRILFQTDSPLERMLYYGLRDYYQGEIVPQHPLGPYWIDLAIPTRKLALECDGQVRP